MTHCRDKHNPQIISIALERHDIVLDNASSNDVFNSSNKMMKIKWNHNHKNIYLQAFDAQRIYNLYIKLTKLADPIQSAIVDITNELQDMFIQHPKNSRMFKEVNNIFKEITRKSKNRYWFNYEYIKSKQEFMKYKELVKHSGVQGRKKT